MQFLSLLKLIWGRCSLEYCCFCLRPRRYCRRRGYNREEWRGKYLWEVFEDDFEGFTKETFQKGGKDATRKLRDCQCLRAKGIYIPKDRKLIAANLESALNGYQEPADDEERPVQPARTARDTRRYRSKLDQMRMHCLLRNVIWSPHFPLQWSQPSINIIDVSQVGVSTTRLGGASLALRWCILI